MNFYNKVSITVAVCHLLKTPNVFVEITSHPAISHVSHKIKFNVYRLLLSLILRKLSKSNAKNKRIEKKVGAQIVQNRLQQNGIWKDKRRLPFNWYVRICVYASVILLCIHVLFKFCKILRHYSFSDIFVTISITLLFIHCFVRRFT